MHSKNNNSKSQNFIQGLRPFSSSIPRGLKKILKKGGYNFNSAFANIVAAGCWRSTTAITGVRFYYHNSCYGQWIQYKKINQCLICEKDISSNYFIIDEHEPLSPRTRRQRFIMTRRERILLRRMRIRDRVTGGDDIFCNIICCHFIDFNRRNYFITWIRLNEDGINKFIAIAITSFGIMGIIVLIYFAILAPWIFTTPST